MSSDTIRVSQIGAGYLASWHADALKAAPGVTLTAVCDLSFDGAQGLANEHVAEAFDSLEA